jgi:hypothetical protein
MSNLPPDEITYKLTAAMMLLEMLPDMPADERGDAAWAAHNLVQWAWQKHAGHPPKPLSEDTQSLLAAIAAKSAIEDAKDRS